MPSVGAQVLAVWVGETVEWPQGGEGPVNSSWFISSSRTGHLRAQQSCWWLLQKRQNGTQAVRGEGGNVKQPCWQPAGGVEVQELAPKE